MPYFYKYLDMGLQNFEEYQVCSISVGVVGDISRAIYEQILPFCDGIMALLLKDLPNSMLYLSEKPPIFSCFRDIDLVIGEQFEKYITYVIPMLQGAVELCDHLNSADEDMFDYGNQLGRGIFEAYSGILQGLKSSGAELMMPHAPFMLQFTEAVFKDKSKDESVTKIAVAALGNLADALGSNNKVLFTDCTFHMEFIRTTKILFTDCTSIWSALTNVSSPLTINRRRLRYGLME